MRKYKGKTAGMSKVLLVVLLSFALLFNGASGTISVLAEDGGVVKKTESDEQGEADKLAEAEDDNQIDPVTDEKTDEIEQPESDQRESGADTEFGDTEKIFNLNGMILSEPTINNITVRNFIEGVKDEVIVGGLTSGDVVKVYDSEKRLSEGTVSEDKDTVTIEIEQLGKSAGSIYISVTRGGVESGKVEVAYSAEPTTWHIYDHTGNKGEDMHGEQGKTPDPQPPVYPNNDDNPAGYLNNQHIIIKNNGSRITFYGYGDPGHKDFILLPSDSPAKKTLKFDLDLSTANYHSMEGAGVLFNAIIEENKLFGYAILFTKEKIELYKINGVDVNQFNNYQGKNTNDGKLTAAFGQNITKIAEKTSASGDLHSITLEVSSSHMMLTDVGQVNEVVFEYDSFASGFGGHGIGFLASYLKHKCSVLSYFTITNVSISDTIHTTYNWPILDLTGIPGNKEAHLLFTAPEGAEAVVLQRSADKTNWEKIPVDDPVGDPEKNYVNDTKLENDQKYYYRLQVFGGKNEGISNVVEVTPKGDIDNRGPIAYDLKITRDTTEEGEVLTGSYRFLDIDGDLEEGTIFKWYRADDAEGNNKQLISGATNYIYTLQEADNNKFIFFEVTPYDVRGNKGTPAIVRLNSAPDAIAVVLTGNAEIGQTLEGGYTFKDVDSDPEGISIFKWYRADDNNGEGKEAIPGATSRTYTLSNADTGKYIFFEVTPVASKGTPEGEPVISAAVGPVKAVVTVSIYKDGVIWENSGKTVTLHQNETEPTPEPISLTGNNGVYSVPVNDGTYNIYIDGANTGVIVEVDEGIDDSKVNKQINYYTVNFNTDGGSPVPSQVVIEGDTPEEPAAPEKENYAFKGWSPTIGPITGTTTYTALWNSPPTSSGISIEGSGIIGQTLIGKYTYDDVDGDDEGTSVYQWYRASDSEGADKQEIEGATAKAYKVTNDDNGKYLFFEVTPIAKTGYPTGIAVQSSALGPISPYSGGGGSTPPPTNTVIGSVIDKNTGETVKGVDAKVIDEPNGTKTVEMKTEEAVVFKKPDGTNTPLADTSRLGFEPKTTTSDGTAQTPSVNLKSDGTIEVKNLPNNSETQVDVTFDLGNGQKIIIGKIDVKISGDGTVSLTSTLIDPYGIITNVVTGEAIEGVHVVLYYADTERNRRTGKVPHTEVDLPILPGFEPNDNKNPQNSNQEGSYAFMVFPNTDYYLVATKEGYFRYTSPTLTVEEEIVKWDFRINPNTVENPITGVHRFAGTNRVDTALAIARATYPGKVDSVIIATANNYPDALTGSVLAYKLQAPIILVGYTPGEEEKVLAYLRENLNPDGSVYLLGGTAVVSAGLESKIRQQGYKTVKRLGGADRYETALKIADEVGVWENSAIVLTSGESYPDALSVSSVAAVNQFPILLVRKNGIDDQISKKVADIEPGKVFIIGGEGAVSEAVKNKVMQITPIEDYDVERIGGIDRYQTSVEVAKHFNLDGSVACFATGNNFPDALAGSVYAAKNNSSIFLLNMALSAEAKDYLTQKNITGAAIFGGVNVVSDAVYQEIKKMIGQ